MLQVICIPNDQERITQLQKKLVEYKHRLAQFASRIDMDYMSPLSKIFILERLLQAGAANKTFLRDLFIQEYGDAADMRIFDNAFACMEDYCTTGGKNLNGGTGLN